MARSVRADARGSHGPRMLTAQAALAGLAVVAASVAVAVAPDRAFAYVLSPEVNAEFDAIVQHNYRGSAQPSPPTCGSVCQDLRAAETRAGPLSQTAEQLHRESRLARIMAGLNPALKALGGRSALLMALSTWA